MVIDTSALVAMLSTSQTQSGSRPPSKPTTSG